MREARPVLARHELHEVALDLHRVLLLRQPEPLRQPPHVRVDDDPLRGPELGGDDVRGLARDAGQADELRQRARHLAVELLEQHPHRAAQRLRLLPVEAGGEDVALELLLRHGEVVLGPAVLLEQRRGDAVDVHVGRLRRQHHRDEQLERVAERERDRRVGVLAREPLDDRPDARALRPDPLARLRDVATRHWRPSCGRTASPQPRSPPAQTRSSAGQPAHANSLGVGRNSPAWICAIASDSSASSSTALGAREPRRRDRVRPLEEVVDDLHLVGAGAEARERVHEPLEPVVVLDDLLRRRVAEHVRLVVDDERLCRRDVQHVDEAVQRARRRART